MSVMRRWTITVCGDCKRATHEGGHLTCDLNARDKTFEVVLASAYDALRDQHRGAVDDLREALRLLDNARTDLHDITLKRAWAAKRKALRAKWGQ